MKKCKSFELRLVVRGRRLQRLFVFPLSRSFFHLAHLPSFECSFSFSTSSSLTHTHIHSPHSRDLSACLCPLSRSRARLYIHKLCHDMACECATLFDTLQARTGFGHMSYTLEVLASPQFNSSSFQALVGLLQACFAHLKHVPPADIDMQGLCGAHDADQCVWVLIWAHDKPSRQLVASAMLFPSYYGVYGSNLCVLPSRRNRGLARLVMRTGEYYTACLGHHRIVGHVAIDNPAKTLYARRVHRPRWTWVVLA